MSPDTTRGGGVGSVTCWDTPVRRRGMGRRAGGGGSPRDVRPTGQLLLLRWCTYRRPKLTDSHSAAERDVLPSCACYYSELQLLLHHAEFIDAIFDYYRHAGKVLVPAVMMR